MQMNWKLIKKALDTVEDHSEFVAGPRPSDPIRGAYHDYSRWVCDSYATVPGWARTAAAVAGWGTVDLAMQMNCRKYLDTRYPIGVPPFTGGQCPVGYYIVYRASSQPGWNQTREAFVNGPIQGTRYIDLGNGNFQFQVLGSSGGVSVTVPAGANSGGSIISVSRLDGQSDNCGNPYATEPTPAPGVPIPPVSPPGGGQPPEWDDDGPYYRPGPIESPYGPPIEFPPIDPWNPGGGDDESPFTPPDPYPPLPPGDQGDPSAPVTVQPGNDAEGEAPSGKVLVGLKIDLTETPESGKQFAPGVWRGACYIYMGGESGLDQDYAGSMIRTGQFIYAERDNLTRWRVSANTGFKVVVTPHYREVEK